MKMLLDESLWGLNEEKRKKYNMGYNTCKDKKIYNSKEYHAWSYMLRLVCEENEKFGNMKNTNKITICNEWLDFKNFNDWFNENYYTVENETMELCRSLLDVDNNEFSPNKCVFVPKRLSLLLFSKNISRNGLPRGVGYREISDTYYSTCHIQKNGKATTIRHSGFKTAEEAFQQYKKDKENYIREVATLYSKKVPRNVYKALITFEVKPYGNNI